MPRGGYWKEVLNSDATIYGGSGLGNCGGVHGRADAVAWAGASAAVDAAAPGMNVWSQSPSLSEVFGGLPSLVVLGLGRYYPASGLTHFQDSVKSGCKASDNGQLRRETVRGGNPSGITLNTADVFATNEPMPLPH